MKYILEKSAVLSFVALKIVVFSALILVITGCRDNPEMKNGAAETSVQEPVSQEAMVKASVEARLAITPTPTPTEVTQTPTPISVTTSPPVTLNTREAIYDFIYLNPRSNIVDWELKYLNKRINLSDNILVREIDRDFLVLNFAHPFAHPRPFEIRNRNSFDARWLFYCYFDANQKSKIAELRKGQLITGIEGVVLSWSDTPEEISPFPFADGDAFARVEIGQCDIGDISLVTLEEIRPTAIPKRPAPAAPSPAAPPPASPPPASPPPVAPTPVLSSSTSATSPPLSGVELAVTLKDENGNYGFDPEEITIGTGQTVKFALTSQGEFHTFTVDGLDIDMEVEAGDTQLLTFTFDEPGTYDLICIPHESLGMSGKIKVIP